MLEDEIGIEIKNLSPIYHYAKVKVFESTNSANSVSGKIFQESKIFNMTKIICSAPDKPISKSINYEV
jgi:hypothetical protein